MTRRTFLRHHDRDARRAVIVRAAERLEMNKRRGAVPRVSLDYYRFTVEAKSHTTNRIGAARFGGEFQEADRS